MEERFATFHLSACLPGMYFARCASDSGSASIEGSEVNPSPAEDFDSGSALAEDFDFDPLPTEGSEDPLLAEDSGSECDPVEDAKSDATLAETLSANRALAEERSGSAMSDNSGSGSGSGSDLAGVPDPGSSAAENSDSCSAPPENLDSDPSPDEGFRCIRCPRCQSNESPIRQCPICGNFQGHHWRHRPSTLGGLRASVAHNSSKTGKCEFCPILLSCLERCVSPDSLRDDLPLFTETHRRRHALSPNGCYNCRNRSLLVGLGKNCVDNVASMEIFVHPGSSSPWPSVQEAHLIPQNTASEASLAWAKRSLQDCLEFHDCCNIPKKDKLFPKRLVDVIDSRMNGSVRLIQTFGRERSYLCLSHCWGDPTLHPQPLKTTNDNLCRHLEGIPWDDLPKTFQDAVDFVRRLGERYIWIDSLCITQDSPEDWAKESAKMSSIYQNSMVTIAATESDNSSGGCFSTPDDEYKAHPFAVKYSNGSYFTLYCRRSQPDWRWPEHIGAPLFKRAWVYQERQLSPRILHFGNQELAWECREEQACECDLWRTEPSGSLRFQKSYWPTVDGSKTPDEPHAHIWHDVVTEYSRLSLTRASDRLPAMAGIAKLTQTIRCNDEYLAGLWKNSLIEDLLWSTWGRRSRNTSLAPSWSWACMDKVDMGYDPIFEEYFTMASFISAELRPDGPDAYLNVPSGSLTVEGYLFTTQPRDSLLIAQSAEFLPKFGFRITEFGLDLHLPGYGPSSSPSQEHYPHEKCLREKSPESHVGGFASFIFVSYYPDCENILYEPPFTANTTLHCLWIFSSPSEQDRDFLSMFLVLRQKKHQGVHERVGLLRLDSKTIPKLPPVSEQTDGALKHTITIV
ncbi:heterokaryon incompatibility protein-domain-containing protein [Phyllosticta capitalensis]